MHRRSEHLLMDLHIILSSLPNFYLSNYVCVMVMMMVMTAKYMVTNDLKSIVRDKKKKKRRSRSEPLLFAIDK